MQWKQFSTSQPVAQLEGSNQTIVVEENTAILVGTLHGRERF